MLSRVAENLYWLGRYLERADNVSRMVDVEYHASIETGAPRGSEEQIWSALMLATGVKEPVTDGTVAETGFSPSDYLILAEDNSHSIRSSIRHARELARGLREHISREVWEEINELHLLVSQQSNISQPDLFDLCRNLKRRIETVFGLYDNTVIFDEGREWFRCGLYIERADMTSRILDTKYYILLPAVSEVGGPLDRFQWTAILKSASAWEAYRKSYSRGITGPGVADLLIFNRNFPRSLSFCTMALLRHFQNAAASTPSRQRLPAERLLVTLEVELRGGRIEDVIRGGLHELLVEFQQRLVEINHALIQHVFRPLPEAPV